MTTITNNTFIVKDLNGDKRIDKEEFDTAVGNFLFEVEQRGPVVCGFATMDQVFTEDGERMDYSIKRNAFRDANFD